VPLPALIPLFDSIQAPCSHLQELVTAVQVLAHPLSDVSAHFSRPQMLTLAVYFIQLRFSLCT
jgi:hypothetical protein